MRQAVIHIGYPKAGSSALQTTLAASRGPLRQKGFLFPPAPAGLHNAFTAHFHHAPQTLFPYGDLMLPPPALQRRMAGDFGRLAERLDDSTFSTVILSSESLIELRDAAVPAVRDFILSHVDKATIVCYVRDPLSYASSLIQERIKQGQTLAEALVFHPTGNFDVWIPPWVEAFGKDNVVVRSIDRAALKDGDVPADFAALIGYDGPLERDAEHVNQRLSQAAILMLDAVNGLKGPLNSKSPAMMRLWRMPGEPFVLSVDFLSEVARRAVPGLEYLKSEWGVVFPPSTPRPPPSDPFGPEARRFLAEVLARAHTPAP